MVRVCDLRSRRSDVLAKMRELVERAESEDRDLTEEEREQFAELERQADQLAQRIARLEAIRRIEPPADGEGAPEPAKHAVSQSDVEIGLTDREARDFSLVRLVRALVSGDWRGAEFEREACEAAAEKLGREPRVRGAIVPYDVLARGAWPSFERRDVTTTTGSGLVATVTRDTDFISLLYARTVVTQAGARVLGGLRGNVSIPRQSGGASVSWISETGTVTESNPTFDAVALSPKTAAVRVDITRRLLLQSTPSVEQLVRQDLARQLAIAVDSVAIQGGGTNQPTGILTASGVNVVSIGTNGGPPTWAHIVQLEREVAVDNADFGALAYVTNPQVRSTLKTTEKATGTAQFVWTDGPAPLNGYRAFVTTLVPSNLTKGTGTNLSAIIFGNFNDLLIGVWGGLEIAADPFTLGDSGAVVMRAFQDVDVALRHPESFARIVDATTT